MHIWNTLGVFFLLLLGVRRFHEEGVSMSAKRPWVEVLATAACL